jgi:hypothetical protein
MVSVFVLRGRYHMVKGKRVSQDHVDIKRLQMMIGRVIQSYRQLLASAALSEDR